MQEQDCRDRDINRSCTRQSADAAKGVSPSGLPQSMCSSPGLVIVIVGEHGVPTASFSHGVPAAAEMSADKQTARSVPAVETAQSPTGTTPLVVGAQTVSSKLLRSLYPY